MFLTVAEQEVIEYDADDYESTANLLKLAAETLELNVSKCLDIDSQIQYLVDQKVEAIDKIIASQSEIKELINALV